MNIMGVSVNIAPDADTISKIRDIVYGRRYPKQPTEEELISIYVDILETCTQRAFNLGYKIGQSRETFQPDNKQGST